MHQTLVEMLQALIGEPYVLTGQDERAYYSHDLSWVALEVADIVVQPGSVEELVAVVKAATTADMAVAPRGGGMSYTHGYAPRRAATVLVDLRRLNRIVVINPEDMYVTVECGCTWEQVYAALRPHGLRTPYWGPLSGRFATVGGALAQNSVYYGSARHGTAADSVLGLEVITASGQIIRTGSVAHRTGTPFFRHFGPDLTGLFLSDGGAFGIKARATLRLIPAPNAALGASFACDHAADLIETQHEMARLGLASELYGYDSYYNNAYAQRGFAFLAGLPWSLHLVVEGADTAEADAALTRLRAIGGRHGREIDGSLPLQARDEPFAKRTRLVNAEGAVWLPTHVLLPYSRARQALQLVDTFLADHVPALHQAGIRTSCLTLAAGANFLLEPSFYWRDQLSPFHRDIMGPDEASQWDALPANPAARQLVIELRQQLSQRLAALGGVHLQLGKYYDYPAMVDPATWTLLGGLKDLLDPRRQMNPGALGLE